MAAARRLYPERGPDVSPESLERAARTEPGAFDRHFTEPADLAFAVFEQNIAAIEILAARPETTFDDVLALMGEQLTSIVELLRVIDITGRDTEQVLVISGRLNGILAAMVDDGHRAGTIDPALSATTVIMGIALLAVALMRGDTAESHRAATVAAAIATLRRRAHPTAACDRPTVRDNSALMPSSPATDTH
jgi:hypothetical protein